MALEELDYIKQKLQFMEDNEIWPNGLRYLWTDAFGLVLYLSLYKKTKEETYYKAKSRTLDEPVIAFSTKDDDSLWQLLFNQSEGE